MSSNLSIIASKINAAIAGLNLGTVDLSALNLGSLNLSRFGLPTLRDFASDRFNLQPNATTVARMQGAGGGFSQLVVFGDSLSDPGNLSKLLVDAGLPTTAGLVSTFVNGRLSNGPVWAETFAASQSLNPIQVKNFATIGATTGRDNVTALFAYLIPPAVAAKVKLPGIQDQVDRYGSMLASSGSSTADPQALHVVWGGGADFSRLRGKTWQQAIAQINQSVNNVIASVTQLAGYGAKTIAVVNLPNLGLAPSIQLQGLGFQGAAYSLVFNTLLEMRLSQVEKRFADLDVVEVDMFSATQAIVADPQTFGLSNVTTPLSTVSGAAVNPNAYLWWDGRHPTTAGHQLIAGSVEAALKGQGGGQFVENGAAFLASRLPQWISNGSLARGLEGLGLTTGGTLNLGNLLNPATLNALGSIRFA